MNLKSKKMSYHNVRDKSGRFTKAKSKTAKITGVRIINPKKKKTVKKLESYDFFLLDKSSSMDSVRNVTINGFNEVLNGIRKTAKENNIDSFCSLLQFGTSGNSTFSYSNLPISNVKNLDRDGYRPSGMTALFDNIAFAIDRLKEFTKDSKNASINLHIFTDGEENNSKEYSRYLDGANKIKALIEDVRDNLNWNVTFIGAGEDSVVKSAASSIGIFMSNTMSYDGTRTGTKMAFGTLNSSNTVSRSKYAASGQSSNDGFFSNGDD